MTTKNAIFYFFRTPELSRRLIRNMNNKILNNETSQHRMLIDIKIRKDREPRTLDIACELAKS